MHSPETTSNNRS